jgi:hypothetical protein
VVNGGAGVDTLVLQGPYGSLTLTANVTQIENISILGGGNTSFGEPGTNRHDYVLTTHDVQLRGGRSGADQRFGPARRGEDFTFDGSAETDASYVRLWRPGQGHSDRRPRQRHLLLRRGEVRRRRHVSGGSGYDGMFLRGNYTIDFTALGYTGLFTSIENLTLSCGDRTSATRAAAGPSSTTISSCRTRSSGRGSS